VPVVPSNALLFRGQGVLVARVGQDGAVKLQTVRLGRNFGDSVEVLEGIEAGQQLVLNPSDSLADGDKVQVVADSRAPAASAAKGRP
jgi:hypothetical protein